MTKKHFKQLAAALATTRPARASDTPAPLTLQGERLAQWENDVTIICQVCEANNLRFDRTRFREAILDECKEMEAIEAERY